MTRKLTDIQLSQILSAADAGELDFFSCSDCYAAFATNAGGAVWNDDDPQERRFWTISDAVQDAVKNQKCGSWHRELKEKVIRPRTAYQALEALRNAGLV